LASPSGRGTSRREGERDVQTVRAGMQFRMEGIGAVVLWVVCGWNRCGEPSQALRASSPGGRAKGLVGIDRWRESQGLGGCR
ncbi:MAG: hypothetical protein II272_05200, partial [Oscillospiraceae bacterium]|nr:hypothetical protein [Oscillospiraceae bacterium]